MKKFKVNLTPVEIEHLLKLLSDSAVKGEYYGNRAEYLARSHRVALRLSDAIASVRTPK